MSQGSSVSTVARLRAGGSIPGSGTIYFSTPRPSDELWNGFGLSLKDSGDETSGAWSKPINSYPAHIYMVRCLIKHMESFHLFVIYLTTLSAADIV